MVNPREVKARAKKLEDNNLRFRSFLKNRADYEELDAQFLELHRELFVDYDCCKCGNCCKNCEILLNENDVATASTYLGQTTESFVADYLTAADPRDELPYKFKSSPARSCMRTANAGFRTASPRFAENIRIRINPKDCSACMGFSALPRFVQSSLKYLSD